MLIHHDTNYVTVIRHSARDTSHARHETGRPLTRAPDSTYSDQTSGSLPLSARLAAADTGPALACPVARQQVT